MKCVILEETNSNFRHSIKRVVIFNHDAFIQEINYWKYDKKITQDTFPLGLDNLKKIININL